MIEKEIFKSVYFEDKKTANILFENKKKQISKLLSRSRLQNYF